MTLSELNKKGQAYTFEDEQPLSLSKLKTEQANKKKPTIIERVLSSADKLGKVADTTFGSLGKVAGKAILGGAESAAQMIEGGVIPESEKQGYSALSTNPNTAPSLGDTAFAALETYPGGGFASKALKSIPGGAKIAEAFSKIPENLRASAIKQYSEALGATKEEFKTLTKKVVPELLDRGVNARTLSSLSETAAQKADAAGELVGVIEDVIPDSAKSSAKLILDSLSKLKNKNIVDGKVVNKEAVKAIDGVEKTIKQFGSSVSQKSLVAVKRILDKTVAGAKGFTRDEIANLGIEAKKEAADAIREIISKDIPDLDLVNKEFAFWKNVQNITEETLKRKSTQGGGLTKALFTAGGAASGFATGDSAADKAENVLLYGAAAGQLAKLLKSPGFKMLSARTLNKFSEILASGEKKKIELAIPKIMSAIKNSTNQENDQ